ncbi:hypothetical protein [Microbispora sp. CA-102843]|uniref:hypothetical protein n=1 Tax=Microbispora sp. CA-102843 TaxID=3239952 RepID=UPI003D8DD4C3
MDNPAVTAHPLLTMGLCIGIMMVDARPMSADESARAEPRDLTEHPGWLGSGYWTGTGVVLGIHADWPAYPCQPGGAHGLFDLAQFPVGTQFEPLDDIDRCVLFAAYDYDAKKPLRPQDPWSPDAFQVAIWHKDLIILAKQGLISGVTPISEREWQLRRRVEAGWKWGQMLAIKDKQGNFQPVNWPSLPGNPQVEDFDCGDPYTYPAFEQNGIDSAVSITGAGWDVVTRELAGTIEVPESLPDLRKQLNHELYDSAIREVGIAIEAALRGIVGSDDGYGQKLVGDFIKYLKNDVFTYNTTLKIYRLRLRTFFKFVRNPHAHHKIPLTQPQALALIAHALHLLSDIQEFSGDEAEG